MVRLVYKGISGAGINGGVQSNGPGPCVVVSIPAGSDCHQRQFEFGNGPNRLICQSGRRVVLNPKAVEVWRESNEGPAPQARVGSGVAGVLPPQMSAEVGARRRP